MKRVLFLIIAAWMLSLAACAGSDPARNQPAGLSIPSSVSGLGGTPDQQTLSYTLTIFNNTSTSVRIEWIKPVLSEGIAKLAGDQNLIVRVAKGLPAGQSIEVTGAIQLNTKGLTKEQIVGMEPFMSGIQTQEQQILPLPGRANPGKY